MGSKVFGSLAGSIVDIMRQSLKLMDCIQKINFYYVFIFFELFS